MYDEVIGHPEIKIVLAKTTFQSTIFEGPTGIGKSTLALEYARNYIESNDATLEDAINSNIFQQVTATDINTEFLRNLPDTCILLMDEIQYLSKKQQQLLLDPLENKHKHFILIATTTENTKSVCFPAILSRCRVIHMYPVPDRYIVEYIYDTFPSSKDNSSLTETLVRNRQGDIRSVLRDAESLKALGWNNKNYEMLFHTKVSSNSTIESLKSALQKSIRGSNPDAACLYAYSLLDKGGLDITCRRLRVIASEDIGLTDPGTVPTVTAMINNALELGMPEARIPIIEAAIYLSLQPKSNSVMQTLSVLESIDQNVVVPPDNISSEYAPGYIYPHNYPNHYVSQEYMPKGISNKKIYTANNAGAWEISRAQYWDRIKSDK